MSAHKTCKNHSVIVRGETKLGKSYKGVVLCFLCLSSMLAPFYTPDDPGADRWERNGDRLVCIHQQPRTTSMELLFGDGSPACDERVTNLVYDDGVGNETRADDGRDAFETPRPWKGPPSTLART